MPKILLIGGSDGSCGAGLFADYQTILSLGSTAGVVVTSVTAQNDQKFLSAYNLPSTNLKSQFESLDDFVFDSISAAENYRDRYGFKRGAPEIVSMRVSGEDLRMSDVPNSSPDYGNEYIYLPEVA